MVVNKKLAMTMSLTLKYEGSTIISYSAYTWSITGFNPRYLNVSASDLTAIYTIDFSGNKVVFNDFYSGYRGKAGWFFI